MGVKGYCEGGGGDAGLNNGTVVGFFVCFGDAVVVSSLFVCFDLLFLAVAFWSAINPSDGKHAISAFVCTLFGQCALVMLEPHPLTPPPLSPPLRIFPFQDPSHSAQAFFVLRCSKLSCGLEYSLGFVNKGSDDDNNNDNDDDNDNYSYGAWKQWDATAEEVEHTHRSQPPTPSPVTNRPPSPSSASSSSLSSGDGGGSAGDGEGGDGAAGNVIGDSGGAADEAEGGNGEGDDDSTGDSVDEDSATVSISAHQASS